MPYDSLLELPDSYKDNLPIHAQEIYLVAFNKAWGAYTQYNDQEEEVTREEIAHRVAWAAVTQFFEERDGQWIRK